MRIRHFAFLMVSCLLVFVACNEQSKKKSGSVSFNIGGEPSTLSPLSAADAYATNVHGYVLETLGERDSDTYAWEPKLATEWTISKDNRVFEFKLREGVKWHDGKEFTAEDVKFSYDVIFSDDWKAVQIRPYYEAIKSVEVLNKYRVRFTVKDDYFQNFDVCAGLDILPKHFYSNQENKKEFGRKLIGTGAYMLTKYDKGQKMIMVKNPDWWGATVEDYKDTNAFPKITLRFASEENVQLELLKKGDIDYLGLRPEGYMKKTVGDVWEEKIVKVKTENKSPKGYSFIGWNLTNPILKDREVRKALSMLFNRQLVIEKFEYGMSLPATGPIYPQSDYANPNVKAVAFDPQGALAILSKAGWKDTDKNGILDKVINGKKTELSLTILEPVSDMVKYLTVYKEEASKVGVVISIKLIEWNSFIKLLDERNFEGVRLAWSGGSVDTDLKQVWHSTSIHGAGSNFISFKNPEVDRMIDLSRKEYDKAKRIPLLQKAHELIANDYPYVFFTNPRYTMYGHTKRIWKPKDTFTYEVGTQYWKMQ